GTFVTIVNTTSTAAATSRGDSAHRMPVSRSHVALDLVRFQPVTVWPASIRRLAMRPPITPSPTKPRFPTSVPLSRSMPQSPRRAQIEARHLRIREQGPARSGEAHDARLHDRSVARNRQSRSRVLLHEKHGSAFFVDLRDGGEDEMASLWVESHRRLVHQQQL